MSIGFIGLGHLGAPIATNLLDSGHDLLLYNRTPAKADALVARGARLAASVAELARECRIVFSIVFDDPAVVAICEGDGGAHWADGADGAGEVREAGEADRVGEAHGADGLLANLAAGSIHVCLSTISPALATTLSQRHAERQLAYVSAPVFGRPDAAVARQLQYAVAGPAAAKAAIADLLRDSGGTSWDFGERVAAANLVKLCGNFLIITAAEAIRESIAIARASEVDAKAMWEMLNQGLIKSPLYAFYSNHVLLQPTGAPVYTSAIPLKDVNLLAAHAAAVGQPLPLPGFLGELLRK